MIKQDFTCKLYFRDKENIDIRVDVLHLTLNKNDNMEFPSILNLISIYYLSKYYFEGTSREIKEVTDENVLLLSAINEFLIKKADNDEYNIKKYMTVICDEFENNEIFRKNLKNRYPKNSGKPELMNSLLNLITELILDRPSVDFIQHKMSELSEATELEFSNEAKDIILQGRNRQLDELFMDYLGIGLATYIAWQYKRGDFRENIVFPEVQLDRYIYKRELISTDSGLLLRDEIIEDSKNRISEITRYLTGESADKSWLLHKNIKIENPDGIKLLVDYSYRNKSEFKDFVLHCMIASVYFDSFAQGSTYNVSYNISQAEKIGVDTYGKDILRDTPIKVDIIRDIAKYLDKLRELAEIKYKSIIIDKIKNIIKCSSYEELDESSKLNELLEENYEIIQSDILKAIEPLINIGYLDDLIQEYLEKTKPLKNLLETSHDSYNNKLIKNIIVALLTYIIKYVDIADMNIKEISTYIDKNKDIIEKELYNKLVINPKYWGVKKEVDSFFSSDIKTSWN